MSLDQVSCGTGRNLLAESHAHAPLNDWEAVSVISAGEGNDHAHASWESAWIDLGGEG